jgi:hypothetical protein
MLGGYVRQKIVRDEAYGRRSIEGHGRTPVSSDKRVIDLQRAPLYLEGARRAALVKRPRRPEVISSTT